MKLTKKSLFKITLLVIGLAVGAVLFIVWCQSIFQLYGLVTEQQQISALIIAYCSIPFLSFGLICVSLYLIIQHKQSDNYNQTGETK